MRLMVIGAHPADAVDLAGGTMALHSLLGDEMMVFTVTDGLRSHSIGDPTVEIKRDESKKAFSNLHCIDRTWFMGLQDEPLIYNDMCIAEMISVIRDFMPDIVVTHHPNEYAHWDHSVTGQMVCRALKGAIKRPGMDKWQVNNVYFFATHFRAETARLGYALQPPDVLVDITSVVERKVMAMCCFKSQGHDDEAEMWKRMNSFEREMGRADGLDYAEGFISLCPLKERCLPISSINKGFYTKEEKDG